MRLKLILFMLFSLLVLGVFLSPPVHSINSTESVSFPEEDKPTGSINLPASLMWRAQLEGLLSSYTCDFVVYMTATLISFVVSFV